MGQRGMTTMSRELLAVKHERLVDHPLLYQELSKRRYDLDVGMGLDRLAVGCDDLLRGPDRFQRDPRVGNPRVVEIGILDGTEQALAKRGERLILPPSLVMDHTDQV